MHYHLESCRHGSVLDVEGRGKVGAGLEGAEQHTPDPRGVPEAEAGHMHGEVAPPMFSEIEARGGKSWAISALTHSSFPYLSNFCQYPTVGSF